MYAWPAGRDASPSSLKPSIATTLPSQSRHDVTSSHETSGRAATSTVPAEELGFHREKERPADPVATLTVVTADAVEATLNSNAKATIPPPIDRIPLWSLVPGVGALHGSTASSIGIRLCDFSAINLQRETASIGIANETISSSQANIVTSPMDLSSLTLQPPVEAISRPSSPSKGLVPGRVPVPVPAPYLTRQRHLKGSTAHPAASDNTSSRLLTTQTQSWPATVNKVHGWRKGRKELMEDVLETVYLEPSSEGMGEMVMRFEGLGVKSAHKDPIPAKEGWETRESGEKDEKDGLLEGLVAVAQ